MFEPVIGLAAAFLTTAAFIPQAVLVIRTRDTRGISLSMYVMFTVGVLCWLLYGIALGSWPMILANTVTISFASLILALKTRDVLRGR